MDMRTPLALDVSAEDTTNVIHVTGDLDLMTAPELQACAESVVARAAEILIDLSGVQYLDSSGLSALIRVQRTAQQAGGSALVSAASPTAERVIETAGLREILMGPTAPPPP
jgi:anti-sigma B factor antagonist